MGQAACFVLLLLLCAGRALAQLPIYTKFLEESDDDPLFEDQRDAFNLHDVLEDVASVAPIAIGCTARGSDFNATLLQKGAVTLQCESGCQDGDEASGQWQVYGMGPFRMDSCICKAALVAGALQKRNVVTVTLGEVESELVPYATLRHFTFCFEGMKCEFDRDTTGSRTPPPVPTEVYGPSSAARSAPKTDPVFPASIHPNRDLFIIWKMLLACCRGVRMCRAPPHSNTHTCL